MKKNLLKVDAHEDGKLSLIHLPVAYELELHRCIECEAFLIAERDGFKRSPLDYWLEAENIIHQRL